MPASKELKSWFLYLNAVSILARICFFLFGLYQDAYLPVKYTDIDYLVFSDAAHYLAQGQSPYNRETYRYTPLLAWMILPNEKWYSFGKFLFMGCDLITGYLISNLLKSENKRKLSNTKLVILSSIWLLNPMVITISTRGSSESVLTVLIMLSLYLFHLNNRWRYPLSAMVLGFAIHFKIYPIIYLPSMILAINGKPIINLPILRWINWKNIIFTAITLISLTILNSVMYYYYGYEFLYHTYLYHLTRLDHRHNFSIYNVALYFKSASSNSSVFSIEKIAFIPQLVFSTIIIPLLFARRDLISCLFMQTFAFVIFNKVMTSQYFIWFLIFLPHFLSKSNLLTSKKTIGFIALGLWVVSQASWLYFAYKLEFEGESTFTHGLLGASCFFFLSNCWILGVFMDSI